MKILYLFISIFLLCGGVIAMADYNPYSIRVVVWDENGNRATEVPVVFTYEEQEKTHITASDGTVAFSLMNFKNVPNGTYINVSCKYGTQQVPVIYSRGTIGTTFNEPSEDVAISAFYVMGFIAIPTTIAGIYWLVRRKKVE